MIKGMYGKGNKPLPRVLLLSIARFISNLPERGESLQFLVSIHEEGTGITWQQNVTVDPEAERFFIEMTRALDRSRKDANPICNEPDECVQLLGARLYETFIGEQGAKVLSTIPPTAVLLSIDETILNLPWELIGANGKTIAQNTPFGRLVTTRTSPRPGRDPVAEDEIVRILAIANPTRDLPAADLEVAAILELGERYKGVVEVHLLEHENATRKTFGEAVATNDFDMIHFAGHGAFDQESPETSAINFADGQLSADDVLDLGWKAPPYLVFSSACESGRAAGGKRLVTNESQSNGLAAAFLSAGTAAYAGYYWPVTDTGAGLFARVFYHTLFERENVGIAFLSARNETVRALGKKGDLTGYSAILYGDAASEHRRDLAMAK